MTKRKCDCCELEFESDTSDQEAAAEYTEKFPDHSLEEAKVICESCYERFWRWYEEHEAKVKHVQ